MDVPAGHHLLANVELARACEELGVRCTFLASRACDPAVFRPLGCDVVPTFSIGPYLLGKQRESELESCLAAEATLAAEYAAVNLPDEAWVLMHTASPWHLRGLAARLDAVRNPRIAVGLMLPPSFWTQDRGTAARLEGITEHALAQLALLDCFVYSETGDVRGGGTLWQPLSERSMAEIDARVAGARSASHGTPVRMGYFGQPRPQKGFDLLVNLLEQRLLGADANVHLEFFLPAGYSAAADRINCASPLARASSRFRDNGQYISDMASVDVVLCAYDPASYQRQMSGIVTEAALLGKAILITAGTAAQYFLDRYSPGSYAVVDFRPDSLVNVLTQSAAFWQQKQTRSLASRPVIRELKRARRFFAVAFGINP